MATSNRKPVLHWITLTIMTLAFVGVASTAKADDDLMTKAYIVVLKSDMLPQVPWADGAIAFTNEQACKDFGAMRVSTQRYTTDYLCREIYIFSGDDIYDIKIAGNMGRGAS